MSQYSDKKNQIIFFRFKIRAFLMRDEWDPGNTCFRKCAQILLHLKMELEKIMMQVIQQSNLARSEKSRRNKQHSWSRKLREVVETLVWRRSRNGEKKRRGKY